MRQMLRATALAFSIAAGTSAQAANAGLTFAIDRAFAPAPICLYYTSTSCFEIGRMSAAGVWSIPNLSTLTATGAVSIGGTLGVTGAVTLASTLSVTGTGTITSTITGLGGLVIGTNGGVAGTISAKGATSGMALIAPQAAAGTPSLTLPNTSGTFAVTAALPLALNSTTGALTYSNPNIVTRQSFTGSGTYTPNANLVKALIECIGSGGGGGGSAGSGTTETAGGGGASGGYSQVLVTAAAVGASQAVTIGAAGTGAAAGNNTGGNGGAVSVGTLCVANGGNGGGGAAAGNGGTGGASGAAGTGDITSRGTEGGVGVGATITTVDGMSGYGAPSVLGGGARGVHGSGSAVAGRPGLLHGSGGSGGQSSAVATDAAGGDGAAGIVIITEFNSQ